MMMVLMILMLRCPHHELLLAPVFCPAVSISAGDDPSVSQSVFTITEKAPTIGPSPGCNAALAGKAVLHLFIY